MAAVSKEIRNRGWRQGDIIKGEAVVSLQNVSLDYVDNSSFFPNVLVLISQDCDLVASVDKEPYVEFLAGTSIDSINAMYQYGRNPRVLHVHYNSGVLNFSINDRFRVRKADFCGDTIRRTSISLESTEKRQILGWIAKRYTRPAFPDTFNERLKVNQKVLDSITKSTLSDKIIVILLDVSEEELSPEKNYDIQILIGTESTTSEKEIDQLERLYEEAFSAIGIVVSNIAVRDETEITLRELRTFKRWDRDYRSFPESTEKSLPPAGIDSL